MSVALSSFFPPTRPSLTQTYRNNLSLSFQSSTERNQRTTSIDPMRPVTSAKCIDGRIILLPRRRKRTRARCFETVILSLSNLCLLIHSYADNQHALIFEQRHTKNVKHVSNSKLQLFIRGRCFGFVTSDQVNQSCDILVQSMEATNFASPSTELISSLRSASASRYRTR